MSSKSIIKEELYISIERGDVDRVTEILDKERPELLNSEAANGWSPTMFACRYGYLDIVKYLHKKGAQFERDKGYCASHAACYGGDEEVVNYLLDEVKVQVNPES